MSEDFARLDMSVSGGCQCGAVRYRATQVLDNAHLCHCRMCQKATGGLFAALVAAPREALEWTRGKPAAFMSSAHVARGFCADCGTPLTFDYLEGDRVNLTIGSLDFPERFPPRAQVGLESRIAWVPMLHKVDEIGATEELDPDDAAEIAATNNQHPDFDTEDPE